MLLNLVFFLLFYFGMLFISIYYKVNKNIENRFSYRDCNATLIKERRSLLKNIFRILFSPNNKLTMGRELEGLFLIGCLGADFKDEHELIIEENFEVKSCYINQAYDYVSSMKTLEAKEKYNLGDWDMISPVISKNRERILSHLNHLYLEESYRLGDRNEEVFRHIKSLKAGYQYKDGLKLVIKNGEVKGQDVVDAWKFLNEMLTKESKKLYNLDNWEQKV